MQTSTKTKAAIGVLGALTAVGVAAWIYIGIPDGLARV